MPIAFPLLVSKLCFHREHKLCYGYSQQFLFQLVCVSVGHRTILVNLFHRVELFERAAMLHFSYNNYVAKRHVHIGKYQPAALLHFNCLPPVLKEVIRA